MFNNDISIFVIKTNYNNWLVYMKKKSDVNFREIIEYIAKRDKYQKERVDIVTNLRMKKISGHVNKGKLLDIGASRALLSVYLKNKNIEYHGIEMSKQRVEAASKITTNVIQGDVMNGVPFSDKMFDYIVLGRILEHVENPVYLLRECRRVLKTKGKLLITTPNARSFLNIAASLFNYLQHSLVVHLYVFSRYELENILKITGFRIEKMETFYFRLIPKRRINVELMLKLFPQLGENLFCVAKPVTRRVEDIVNIVR